MTYSEFRYVLVFKGNFDSPFSGADFADAFIYSSDSSFSTVMTLSGLSRADFSARYGIPSRTLEQWAYGKAKPPQYVLDMLAFAVISDKYKGSAV